MILDTISNIHNYKGLGKVYTALEFLAKTDFTQMELGKYILDDNIFYMVQEYTTDPTKTIAEAHKKYIDIQFIVSGIEVMDFCDITKATPNTEYNAEKDVMFDTDCPKSGSCAVEAGEYAIFFPHDVHKPGMCFGNPAPVKKIVVKVKV